MVDTTGLEAKRRAAWRALAQDAGVPAYAVTFDVPEKLVRERNRARGAPVPPKVVAAQLREAAEVFEALPGEGFEGVAAAAPVELVPPAFLGAPAAAARQADAPLALEFGLQISRFGWEGATAETLAEVARAAEDAGFSSLWVMDHFVQIPQVGREWEDMLESYTTLGYLAGVTSRIRLGTLVTGVTYRNLAHLAKVVATLDVVSGGRALCGIGAGWFEREHTLYGYDFPPLRERFARLEDALELLPLMWGKGSPRFEGRTITVPEATCYPRPLQERIPILVGGSGEQRTLRLVARHADACNLTRRRGDGAAQAVACCGRGARPRGATRRRSPSRTSAPRAWWPRASRARARAPRRVEEHVGRYRELAEAGVQTAIVGAVGRARAGVGDALRRRGRGVPMRLALLLALLFAAGCGGSGGPPQLVTETVGQRAADGDDRAAGRRRAGAGGALPPRLGRDAAALLPAVARPPRPRGQRGDLPALPGLVRRPALGGARQRARGRAARAEADRRAAGLARGRRATRPAARSPPTTPRSRAPRSCPCRWRCSAPTRAGRCGASTWASRRSTRRGSRATRRSSRWRAANDRVVGSRVARRIARSTGGRLVVVDDPRASDHLGPQRANATSRREFWDRLDALIRRARG